MCVMKKTLILSLLLCGCITLLFGCSKEFVISPSSVVANGVLSVQSENFVSIEQIRDYANTIRPQVRSNGEADYTVTPYSGDFDTPLMYIVNFGNREGWQILSSDARTPAVIAEGGEWLFLSGRR